MLRFMKRTYVNGLLVVLFFMLLASGWPPKGLVFSHIRGPVAISGSRSEHGFNGYGEASAYSVAGIAAFGNAGIEQAKVDGARRSGSNFPQGLVLSHIDFELI